MSLIISNRLTDKQRDFLKELDYYGDFNLTVQQAAVLIDELLAQQKQDQTAQEELYNHDYIQFNGEHYDIF